MSTSHLPPFYDKGVSLLEYVLLHDGWGATNNIGSNDFPNSILEAQEILWDLLLEQSLWIILWHIMLVLHCVCVGGGGGWMCVGDTATVCTKFRGHFSTIKRW